MICEGVDKMLYRKMPGSEEELSILGYGCMRFPTKAGRIDKEEALKQIRFAIDSGVNYIDTAYPYHGGGSESFLGDYVLKDGYREKVKIATKLPTFLVKKPDDMMKYFEKQRSKLKVDMIDYYLMHTLDGPTWDKMKKLGAFEFMDELKASGKISKIGFSYHGTREDFMQIVDDYPWDFCQIQFNILDENYQAGLEGLNYAHSKGLGVIAMEPLRGGQLVGKVPKSVESIWDEADEKRSPVDWALSWIWNHPAIQVVLSGMNEMPHIEENIAIASKFHANGLNDKEIGLIDRAKEEYHTLLRIGCTGCRYCLPCPAGIDIPFAFQSYNNYHMFDGKMQSKFMYISAVAKKPAYTRGCIDCGKCEEACPQHIQIRSEFKGVQKNLEGPGMRAIGAVLSRVMK